MEQSYDGGSTIWAYDDELSGMHKFCIEGKISFVNNIGDERNIFLLINLVFEVGRKMCWTNRRQTHLARKSEESYDW